MRRGAGAERSGPAGPLGLAGICLLALALIWVVVQGVPAAQFRDALALRDFTLLSRPRVDAAGNFLIDTLEPTLYIIWGTILVCVAIVRRRARVAIAVVALMVLAPLTADILKPLLAYQHAPVVPLRVGDASWPSGHSSAAAALVLSAVLVAPRGMRPIVAVLGAGYAVALGCALLILAWHMPSDVVGGFLLAGLLAALAVAGVRASERRWPSRRLGVPAEPR
jgi:membrane-associated phospholipid phosphatase